MEEENQNIRISVRNLVEFILRSGNLDNTRTRKETDAMQEGSRIHRKLQKQMGANYAAEVHETHPRKSKFLENAVKEHKKDVIKLVANELRKEFQDEL